MNISSMQNPNDLYSYYPPSLYQPFGTFDEHTQWASNDTSTGIPPTAQPGPLQYHPQMYPTSGLDITRGPFDYQPAHQYTHYHPAFPPSTYPGAPSAGASAFDMPWNSHNLSMPVGVQQQMQPIGGQTSNKKLSVYDEYPSTSVAAGDMLAQQMNSIDLSDNHNRIQNYENGKTIHTQNFSILSSREQQNYQSAASNHSMTRPTSSSGPKSYASVVSSDTINLPSNRSASSFSNINMHPNNERLSNISNDTANQRSNNQQYRNSTTGYNPRHQHQQQHQSQQQSSGNNNGNFLNWTNNNSEHSNNNTNPKRQHNSSSRITNSNQSSLETMKSNHQYNPKDFNLNPKGARFFVIKSYSEDDVHRSIKYNIWCSTEHGNKRLDNAFREREGKGPIYLFFSVNASGHFCGMAEMMSPIDYEHQTDVWHMSNKWQGKFEVKWIYVKDVPNQQFRNIRLENNENKPVTNSRDTQEIPYEKGKLMLKTLHMYRHKTSIFDDFQYYESKQAEEVTTKQYPTDDFNHDNKRSNRTSATAQLEQQQNEHDHDT